MPSKKLIIQVGGDDHSVPFDSFVVAVNNTLQILRDIDADISKKRRGVVDWRIVEVSFSSPLSLTILADSPPDCDIGAEVVDSYISGLKAIEQDNKAIPPHFHKPTLEDAKRLVSVLNDGVDRVFFSTDVNGGIAPTQRIAAHVDEIIRRQYHDYDEYGSIEGMLEMLSVHRDPVFNIYDVLTGQRIPCYFDRDLLDEAKEHFGFRVSVGGLIHYTHEGKPISIDVQDIRRLRDQSELPQADDLADVNITDGMDATEYIRSLRDAA